MERSPPTPAKLSMLTHGLWGIQRDQCHYLLSSVGTPETLCWGLSTAAYLVRLKTEDRQAGNESFGESGMQVFPYFQNSCLRYICDNHGRGSLGIPKRSMGSVWDMVKGRQGNIKKNKCGCLVLRDTGHGKEFCVTQGHAILQGFSQNKCLFWVDGEGATLAYGGVAEGATMKTHGV